MLFRHVAICCCIFVVSGLSFTRPGCLRFSRSQRHSTMKKNIVLISITLLFAFGCSKKAAPPVVVGSLAQIMPPGLKTPGPINITAGTYAVNLTGSFVGPKSQTVTISWDTTTKTFSSTTGPQWMNPPIAVNEGTKIIVTASIAGSTYTSSPSRPQAAVNYGADTTMYLDTLGNQSIVNIY